MNVFQKIAARAQAYVVTDSGLVVEVNRINSSQTRGEFLALVGLGGAAALQQELAEQRVEGLAEHNAQRLENLAKALPNEVVARLEVTGDKQIAASVSGFGIAPDGAEPGIYRHRPDGMKAAAIEAAECVMDEIDADPEAKVPKIWLYALSDSDRSAIGTALRELQSVRDELLPFRSFAEAGGQAVDDVPALREVAT